MSNPQAEGFPEDDQHQDQLENEERLRGLLPCADLSHLFTKDEINDLYIGCGFSKHV